MRCENLQNRKLQKKIIKIDLPSFIAKTFLTVSPGVKYCHNWHIDLIAEYLTAAEKGEIKRLIINMPPRHLKSIAVSVAWPAWLLGHNPARRIICSSYSSNLSVKHSLDTRLTMESSWYKKIFPETILSSDQNEKAKFMTTKRGFRMASSVDSAITGEGGNFLIVDDPHNPTFIESEVTRKAALEWFDKTFSTRLDDKKNGVFVVVMQRLHAGDLSGHLLKKSGWHQLKISAEFEQKTTYSIGNFSITKNKGEFLHEEREGAKELKQAKEDLGSAQFRAQYMQEAAAKAGQIIKLEWFSRYKILPEFESIIQSWDTAFKTGKHNDFSAATTWGILGNKYYLIDVFQRKMQFPELKKNIMAYKEKFKANLVLIEDKASGQAVIQELRKEININIKPITPTHDKITRLSLNSAIIESGRVFIPEKAEWLFDFETELSEFPGAKHDDMVDSMSQFLTFTNFLYAEKIRIKTL